MPMETGIGADPSECTYFCYGIFTALPHFLSLDLAEGSRWILYCNRSSADTFLPDLSTPILYFIGVKRKDSEFCFDNLQYWNWFKIGEGVPL